MFTGLIEATGTLRRVAPLAKGVRVVLAAPEALVGALSLGESVACDGACLTVVRFGGDQFEVDASAETLARTSLGDRRPGDRLHLERALRLGDRLGGHIVAGHIDGTGGLLRKTPLGEAVELWISAPPEVARYLIEKGSIAVDGVSLTVNAVDDTAGAFSVVLIPHTQGIVHLAERPVGARLNLEADLLGKYVERLLHWKGDGPGARPAVDLELLARAGFMQR